MTDVEGACYPTGIYIVPAMPAMHMIWYLGGLRRCLYVLYSFAGCSVGFEVRMYSLEAV